MKIGIDSYRFHRSTPINDGYVDNQKLAQLLKDAGYQGFLAVETDFLHPEYPDEHNAVRQSIEELRRIVAQLH